MKGNGSGLTELECVIATRDSVTITIIHLNLTVSTWGTVIKMKKNASIGNIALSARPNYKDTFARNGKTPVLIANVLNHRKVSPCLRTQRNSLRNYFLVRNKFVWISLFENKLYKKKCRIIRNIILNPYYRERGQNMEQQSGCDVSM